MGGMGINDDFGTSVSSRFVAFLKNQGTRMPVLSLGYSAALLEGRAEVSVLDLGDRPPDDATLEAVLATRPDWIVSATSFAYLGTELQFLQRAHERCGAKRLLVGATATYFAKDILERGLGEVIASGDPEVAVEALAAGKLVPGMAGCWMLADGTAVAPSRMGIVADLDTLPLPDWSKFPRETYRYFPLLRKRRFLTILSSRGCPYVCSFCPYPVAQGAPFRGRTPAKVVAELRTLVELYGVEAVLFRDPTFTMDLERAKDICRGVIDSGLKLEWGIETRLDRMDPELIELLGKAGCASVEFGVDPLEDQTLSANHRRPLAPSKVSDVVKALESNGMRTAGLAVLGVPEQTEEEMLRTMDWVEELGLSYVNYELATPFPGTPLYTEAVEKGWAQPIKLDDLLAGDPKLTFNGKVDGETMRRLQDTALKRFYVRPQRVVREALDGSLLESAKFFTQSGLRFLGRLGKS